MIELLPLLWQSIKKEIETYLEEKKPANDLIHCSISN